MKKLPNRIFALIFVLIILAWMSYQFTSGEPGKGAESPAAASVGALIMYSTVMVGYPIVVLGLLQEIRRPSIDFKFHRSALWLAFGAFLLAIFLLVNEFQWSCRGEFSSYFLGGFCMETSSFSLLFGLLFMTLSTPQRSHSYKIMLVGAVLFELFVMIAYLLIAVGVYSPPTHANFWTETVTTKWFWYDFLSEAAILGGALWLLRRGKRLS